MNAETKIVKIADLVIYLNDKKVSIAEKVKAIKIARENDEITEDEALKLCIKFI